MVSVALTSCTGRAGMPHDGVRGLWNDYRQLQSHKAIAMAGEPDGAYVYGVAAGQPSLREARRLALETCQERRAERRFQMPCRYYAVEERVVW